MKSCRRWYVLLPLQTFDQSIGDSVAKLILRPLGCFVREPATMAYFLPSSNLVQTGRGSLHDEGNLFAIGVIE
jgi:hypothetical protein